jgi:hypothetical protein
VRAAGAEVGRAHQASAGFRQHALVLGLEEGQALADAIAVGVEAPMRAAMARATMPASEIAVGGSSQAWWAPATRRFVELADDARAHVFASSCRASPSAGTR